MALFKTVSNITQFPITESFHLKSKIFCNNSFYNASQSIFALSTEWFQVFYFHQGIFTSKNYIYLSLALDGGPQLGELREVDPVVPVLIRLPQQY